MRTLFAIVMLAAAMALAGFGKDNRLLNVDGQLVIHGHEKRNCSFEMLVKGDERLLAKSKTDSAGRFKLHFVPSQEHSFDFFYIDSHHPRDTMYLKSFTEFDSDPVALTFYTFKGVVAVDENDQVICPKCERSDKVNPLPGLRGYYYCGVDRIKF